MLPSVRPALAEETAALIVNAMPVSREPFQRCRIVGSSLTVSLASLVLAFPAYSQVRTITATGEYRMGDNDTRTDAKRLALLDAKRLALEQVGTYIESTTLVKNMDLTQEEIRAYTAGVVELTEHTVRAVMEGETMIVRVDATARIDTDVVARQIVKLREERYAGKELLRAQKQIEQLRHELEVRTQELAHSKSKPDVEVATKRRQQALDEVEVNMLLHRVYGVMGASLTGGVVDFAQARQFLDRALALAPSNSQVHFVTGMLLQQEGNTPGAIRAFGEAVRLNPSDVESHRSLAVAFESTDDVSGAIREYRTIVQLQPEDAQAHVDLADALYEAKMMKSVIAEYQTALRLSRDVKQQASVHGRLGGMYYELEQPENAIAEFRASIRLRPDNSSTHYMLLMALLDIGDRKGALKEYDEFLRLAPDTEDTRLLLRMLRVKLDLHR